MLGSTLTAPPVLAVQDYYREQYDATELHTLRCHALGNMTTFTADEGANPLYFFEQVPMRARLAVPIRVCGSRSTCRFAFHHQPLVIAGASLLLLRSAAVRHLQPMLVRRRSEHP